MKTTAVIPVRKGSQRVRDKNLRPFAGTTLLENKIQTLLKVPEIDEIVVNTNSEAAIELVELEYAGTKVRTQVARSITLLRSVPVVNSSNILER